MRSLGTFVIPFYSFGVSSKASLHGKIMQKDHAMSWAAYHGRHVCFDRLYCTIGCICANFLCFITSHPSGLHAHMPDFYKFVSEITTMTEQEFKTALQDIASLKKSVEE